MSNIYMLAFEGFLAVLLIIAILYCIRLDGKLKALRTGNMRMLEAARELQNSVLHAENAVTALRRSADAAGKDLQARIEEARAVATTVNAAVTAAQTYLREDTREPAAASVRAVDFSLRRRSVL